MSVESAGTKFRSAVKDETPLQVVGTINAYHARLAERSGYALSTFSAAA
jgi:methylisocitrate lyase